MIYRITSKDKLNTSIAFSRTEYDQAMVDELGVSADTLYDEGFILDYQHTERAWWVNGRVDHFGEGYRTDLGFRPQVGFNSGWLGGANIWWGEEGDFFQRTAWGASASHAERVSGGLLEQDFRSWLNTQGPRQSQGSVDLGLQTINFSDRDFELVNGSVSAFAQATGNFALAFDVTLGDWVDFAHARPATRYLVRPSAEYTLGRHLNIHGRYTFSRLDVDMGHLFSAHAPELRIIYQFNARAFIRLVLQYRWIDRTTDNYAFAIDSRSESLLTQFLFSYKLNPQTAIYAGYSDNQLADDDFDLTRMDRTFFTKFSYAWVR
jgi:hypothetical protein